MGHLDEAGFAMTLPTNYSWYPKGERLLIPYEAPQGRRVNAIGAYISHGVEAGQFTFATYVALPASRAKQPRPLSEQAAAHGLREEEVGPIDSERFLQFVWSFAGRPVVHPADWDHSGNPPKDEVLVVGDALQTDALGAARMGFDFVFVQGGIHAGEPFPDDFAAQYALDDWHPVAVVDSLR